MTTYRNVLLSYPRSGNHLTRFFIELLSEIPTKGCEDNDLDIPLHKNSFSEKIPFNISKPFDQNEQFWKYHEIPNSVNTKKLILIVRNPKEVLIRHEWGMNPYKENRNTTNMDNYFKIIDVFLNHKSNKLLLHYEDILTNKKDFINKLYDFLEVEHPEKKAYVLSNIENLFKISSGGSGLRNAGGFNSTGMIDYYYKDCDPSIKSDFDTYIEKKCEKYQFLKEKYNI